MQNSVSICDVIDEPGLVMVGACFFEGDFGTENFYNRLYGASSIEDLDELSMEMNLLRENLSLQLEEVVLKPNVFSTDRNISRLRNFKSHVRNNLDYLGKNVENSDRLGKKGINYLYGIDKKLSEVLYNLQPYDGVCKFIIPHSKIPLVGYSLVGSSIGHVLEINDRVSIIASNPILIKILAEIAVGSYANSFYDLEDKLFLYLNSQDSREHLTELNLYDCVDMEVDKLEDFSIAN